MTSNPEYDDEWAARASKPYTLAPIDLLAAALAKAQSEMSNPKFDSENPHFRSKFASLAAVRNAVIPVMSKHGIFVSQELTRTDRGVACAVILMHSSGQTHRYAPFEIPISKEDAQGVVSASTYARRITLQAVACVAGDSDDDGNAAAGKSNGDNARVKYDPPDGQPNYSISERDRYVSRFTDAFDMDAEQIDIAKAVKTIHEEIAHKHALYVAVGEELGTRRKAIREYLEILKKQKAA